MRFILLDISPEAVWIVGIIIGVVITIISGLVKYSISELRKLIDKIEANNIRDHDNFERYIKNLEKEDQVIKSTINDVNVKILVEVNSITVKLAEYKRDIKN